MSDFDHIKIISNLSEEERNFLLEKSDARGLRHFALHAGAIVVCTILILLEAPLLPLILLVQGILICFLFTLLHETVHRTPFKSEFLNIWAGRLCGFLIFLGPEWFRYFHLAHHRYTHNPEKDPELASPKPATAWQYLKYLSGIPEWINRIKTLFRNAIIPNQDNFVPARGKAKVMREARIQLALYGVIVALSLLFASPAIITIWLLPILLGGPFLRGYLLAEHARCPHVASMLENTRTTFTNRIIRFLAWNMPYHVEHHTYPNVPFHKLPVFHRYTKEHSKYLENGYLGFNRTYLKDSISGDIKNDVISASSQ